MDEHVVSTAGAGQMARPGFCLRASQARGWLFATAVCLTLAWGCATQDNQPHRNLRRAWGDFSRLPAERALAIAGDPRGERWLTAAVGGHPSVEAARAAALAECQRRRQQRRFQASCELYAVGSEIVWRER